MNLLTPKISYPGAVSFFKSERGLRIPECHGEEARTREMTLDKLSRGGHSGWVPRTHTLPGATVPQADGHKS